MENPSLGLISFELNLCFCRDPGRYLTFINRTADLFPDPQNSGADFFSLSAAAFEGNRNKTFAFFDRITQLRTEHSRNHCMRGCCDTYGQANVLSALIFDAFLRFTV